MVLADEICTSRFWVFLLSEVLVYRIARRRRNMQVLFCINLTHSIIIRRKSSRFMGLLIFFLYLIVWILSASSVCNTASIKALTQPILLWSTKAIWDGLSNPSTAGLAEQICLPLHFTTQVRILATRQDLVFKYVHCGEKRSRLSYLCFLVRGFRFF